MIRNLFMTLAIVGFCTSCGTDDQTVERSSASSESTDWSRIFQGDLTAVRQIILENHPGPVDSLNPEFRIWLDAGYERQMRLADTLDSAESYRFALRRYIAGFRDGHLGISFDLDEDVRRWPGFITTWRNDAIVVYSVSDELAHDLPEGSLVVSCDGLSPQTILETRVFDFQLDPEIPGNWVAAAARAFIDFGNPFVATPGNCTFAIDGEEKSLRLSWREFSWDQLRGDYDSARDRMRPDALIHSLTEGVLWFQAPTFSPNEEQVAAYRQALKRIREARHSTNLVVFDLRGNNGGASVWAERFAEALWNEAPQHEQTPEDGQYVEWRVSAGNLSHWETIPAMLAEQFGESDPAVLWARHVLRNLEKALENDLDLWRETDITLSEEDSADGPERSSLDEKAHPPYDGTVAVLTNSVCASACLDALDLLVGIPKVIHVGSVTGADTQYMEARQETLPSGFATLTIPIKVYRGRNRPQGGYYSPDIRYQGLRWDDVSIQRWLLSLWQQGALDRR